MNVTCQILDVTGMQNVLTLRAAISASATLDTLETGARVLVSHLIEEDSLTQMKLCPIKAYTHGNVTSCVVEQERYCVSTLC